MNQHIQNIEISNFKSIKDLKIDGCKKINIFAGKPNAGKSNILEALGMFDLFFNPFERQNFKNFVRYESFSDLFFEGNYSKTSQVKLNTYSIFSFYSIANQILKIQLNSKSSKIESQIEYSINGNQERSSHIISDSIKKTDLNIRKYSFKIENEIVKFSNSLISPFGENISTIISTNPEIRNFVNYFLSVNNLKLLIERGSNNLKIFKEYEDGTVFTLPYNMIADTLQRLIFYKTAIMSNQNSVLLFEEPEAHCFEPYILEFTNEVKFNENNNQFFMVTHSDFIIQEFLRDEESKNNLQIYLVNNVDGKTEVKKLDKENNDDVYEYGMNVFFNFDSLWENN
ncbi:ATP-dependent nuclease [Chryseobacterium profundimaris]|uniref:ATPase/GTPase, AAA15 family n=1 Tax=Chryseobacterium profundimaris TaxID=1387275 RepID=A0ABY1PCK1_9FLAO|nr:AAA family ATPase [Chryseobacterium profundimaris]SMP31200.1 ATPase/GTPase, AAA15 family [Chryseobacterium profundimaris]